MSLYWHLGKPPEYTCDWSGLTDVAFTDFANLLALTHVHQSGARISDAHVRVARSLMQEFKDAGIGTTFDEVQRYIEGHANGCAHCRELYHESESRAAILERRLEERDDAPGRYYKIFQRMTG